MNKKNIILYTLILIIIFISISLFIIYSNKEGNNLNNEISEYSYNNPIIPKGFKKIETDTASWELDEEGNPKGWNDGLVIEDEKGNQFIWVPCTIDGRYETVKYSRYIIDNNNLISIPDEKLYESKINQNKSSYFVETDSINNEIYRSIERNQGFYIGRFETGIEKGDLLPITNDYTKECFTLWQNGTPVIKENSKVWNYITRDKAAEISKDFSHSEDLQSQLITSFCFDTTLKWISTSIPDFFINSQNYGNYNNIKKDNTGHILTGTDNKFMYKNIYDLAGNMREFTTEISINDSNLIPNGTKQQFVLRENHEYVFGSTDIKSCFSRFAIPKEWYNISCSFRIILFIK